MKKTYIYLDAEKVDRVRKERGLRTRSALSRKMGMMPQSLTKIYSGKANPTIAIVGRFCKALDCTPNDILTLNG